jgi:MHS family proline/betaine transporter-like MFS transporter
MIFQAVVGVLAAGYMGALPALMELFPASIRTTGLSIGYSCGVAIFGGFAPAINAWLIEATGNRSAPSFYLMAAALVSLVALNAARRLGIR